MKMLLSNALLVLLVLGISCKKPLEVEEITEPPLPPAGCRIVRTVYKNQSPFISKFTIVEPEKLTLDDGRQVQVGLISTTTYKYDQQGRIVEQLEKSSFGGFRITKYRYSAKQVVESYEFYKDNNQLSYIDTYNVDLNDQGFWTRYDENGQSVYVYNTDNQLVRDYPVRPPNWSIYQDGNRVEQIRFATWMQENGQWVPVDYQYRRYEYNLQRPNIPVIRQYLGADSRNLPTKEVWEMKRSSEFADGPVYQKTFTYFYDKRGLVKRRISNGKSLNSGWLLEDDTYGVGVTDYEYSCP